MIKIIVLLGTNDGLNEWIEDNILNYNREINIIYKIYYCDSVKYKIYFIKNTDANGWHNNEENFNKGDLINVIRTEIGENVGNLTTIGLVHWGGDDVQNYTDDLNKYLIQKGIPIQFVAYSSKLKYKDQVASSEYFKKVKDIDEIVQFAKWAYYRFINDTLEKIEQALFQRKSTIIIPKDQYLFLKENYLVPEEQLVGGNGSSDSGEVEIKSLSQLKDKILSSSFQINIKPI